MNYSYFVGLDTSKYSFTACLIDSSENILLTKSYTLDLHGLKSFLKDLPKTSKSSFLFGIEASGCYHLNLISFLTLHNYPCVVINPLLIHNFSKLNLRKTKTDLLDAKIIAIFIKNFHHKLPQDSFISEEFKELARERERIAQEIAKKKNYIEKLLVVTFPELERVVNIYNETILKILEKFPSAKAISNAQQELASILSSQKERLLSISVKDLKNLARESIAQNWPVKEYILKRTIKELFFLKKSIKEIESFLREICKKASSCQDLEILLSIDGIGETTAFHFLAEIKDISRFSSYKKLIAYAGLDPSVYQSGEFKGKSKISKRGNRHLRRIIWIMSVNVIRHNTYFYGYFLRKRWEGKPYKKRSFLQFSKLLRVIYALLKKKQFFKPSFPLKSQLKEISYAYNFS